MYSIILATLISFTIALPAPAFMGPAPLNFIADKKSNDVSIEKRSQGGVRLSDGVNFTGHVWYGVYPLNECIGLNDYAHNVLSFRPDEGTECMVMQDECNSSTDYVSIHSNSTYASNLGVFDWIKAAESYFCMTEMPLR